MFFCPPPSFRTSNTRRTWGNVWTHRWNRWRFESLKRKDACSTAWTLPTVLWPIFMSLCFCWLDLAEGNDKGVTNKTCSLFFFSFDSMSVYAGLFFMLVCCSYTSSVRELWSFVSIKSPLLVSLFFISTPLHSLFLFPKSFYNFILRKCAKKFETEMFSFWNQSV